MEHLRIKTEHKRALSVSDKAMSAYKRCWLVSAKSFDSLTSVWNDENYQPFQSWLYDINVMCVSVRQRQELLSDKHVRSLFISIAICKIMCLKM